MALSVKCGCFCSLVFRFLLLCAGGEVTVAGWRWLRALLQAGGRVRVAERPLQEALCSAEEAPRGSGAPRLCGLAARVRHIS